MMFSFAQFALVIVIAFAFMQIGLSSRAGPHAPGISKTDIKEICSQSPDPVECPKIIKAIPDISEMYSLEELSDSILSKAQEDSTATVITLETFKSKDPVLQHRYSACSEYYRQANAAIDQRRPGQFDDLVLETKMALDSLKKCIDLFAKEKNPDPHHVKEATVTLRNYVGVSYGTGKVLVKRSGDY